MENKKNLKKIFSVAILGCGARGAETYGRLFQKLEDKFQIVALCDVQKDKLAKYRETFHIAEENCFDDEETFLKEKRADLLVIATMDNDHVRQSLSALALGYDILLEKPITKNKQECYDLLEAQKKYGGKILVCHVLRYAPTFMKVAELLKKGAIGKLVSIQALEGVGYWHQAHSFVRGNWRNEELSSPMIMQKCCHDMDLLQYYAGSPCESISSVGSLVHFKPENAPEGSAERCLDCKEVDTCPYSAKRSYIERWEKFGKPKNAWPYNILTPVIPLTEEVLMKAIKEGPYGRCVYHCDNDVVDHQVTQINFQNGVKASLIMTAFTAEVGRVQRFFGTKGEIILSDESGVELKIFGKEPVKVDVEEGLDSMGYGHGGGDYVLLNTLFDMLNGTACVETSLEASIESHLMAICAEESRKEGGKLIRIHD